MTTKKNFTATVCILFLLLSALFVRLPFYKNAQSMPITDGGLFYTMTIELVQNNFLLPKTTQYNYQDIPFTYPPFSFYLTGFINKFFGVDLFKMFLYLPLISNLLSIPAFFLLSKELLHETNKAFIASFVFTVSISSFECLIMGGGIARSPAFALFILMTWLYISGLRRRNKLRVIFAGISYGLIFGFHIETGYAATLTIPLITICFSKNKFGIYSLLSVFLLGLSIYSPVFLLATRQNGIEPFLNALRSGSFNIRYSLYNLFSFDPFGISPVLNIVGVFTIFGLIRLILKKDWFLPLWIFIVYFLDPRSFDRFAVISASLVFSYTIFNFIPRIYAENEYLWGKKWMNFQNLISFALSLTVAFATTFVMKNDLTNLHELALSDRMAFKWINENISSNKEFVVIPTGNWWSDSVSEWFPALTKQKSYLTVQGLEWKDSFQSKQEELNEFLLDRYSFGLAVAISNLHSQVDYVYCSTNESDSIENHCPIELEGFESIYNNGNVIIYQDISNSLSHVEEK